jgi:YHS domain-containing protein
MNKSATQKTPSIRFDELNWVATTPLPRDQEQSHRLHEPNYLIGTIDPVNGHDISDVKNHPSLVDGNLTIYFESEETKDEFLKTPVNHPFEHSLGKPSEDQDRGG